MTLTGSQILAIEQWKEGLPNLEQGDLAFVVGHKVALETVATNDGSWEFSMLSRIIKEYAWRLSYCRYVDRCLDQCGVPVSYLDWKKAMQ